MATGGKGTPLPSDQIRLGDGQVNGETFLHSPQLKRKPIPVDVRDRVHLDRVLGLTVTNNTALSVDPNTGTVAYPAGCVIVLYNPKKDTQAHIISPERKTITCLAFSGDGKYLVTGESGHKPEVRVFNVDKRSQYTSFKEHDIGINCVAFSPNREYVVSVGCEHDKQVIVWDCRKKEKVAYSKITSDVDDLAFMEESSKFVTVGKRYLRFWSIQTSKEREVVHLENQGVTVGEQLRNNTFCGVVRGLGSQDGSIFVITKSGLLCQINSARTLTRHVKLGVEGANSIATGEGYIFVGCAKGEVQVYDPEKLELVASIPRPHCLGVDVSADPDHVDDSNTDNPRYPDTIALVLDDNEKKLTCIYNDHSIYTYDVEDVKQATKTRSCMYHSQSIWGIEAYPESSKEDQCVLLPSNSFITCSGDDTIRIWNLNTETNDKTLHGNSYSNELLKVIYTDSDLTNLCKREFVPRNRGMDNGEEPGIRAMNVSPEGRFLASGDKGNVRIHDLQTMECQLLPVADSGEVTSLHYSKTDTGAHLLASANHNNLYVFDVEKNYEHIQTINDHSSTINAARFAELDGQLHLLSCGADKSIMFRSSQKHHDFKFQMNHQKAAKATLYDMDVDPTNNFVVTACQDRYIRIYKTRDGKMKKKYRGSQEDDGTLRTVVFDPSGTYIATSCSEKTLNIYDFSSGECMATMSGHSELITGAMFSNNLRHLVSVSADGCIFIWTLPSEITENMKSRLEEMSARGLTVAKAVSELYIDRSDDEDKDEDST